MREAPKAAAPPSRQAPLPGPAPPGAAPPDAAPRTASAAIAPLATGPPRPTRSHRRPRPWARCRARGRAHPLIAVDAMGGDHAPEEIVAGAVTAVREHQARASP